MKKYLVTLTADEREQLAGMIAAGKAAAKKLAHGPLCECGWVRNTPGRGYELTPEGRQRVSSNTP
jgi:hypothetical protein